MLLQNVLYSTIDLYIKKINQYLKDGYVISADFKTYDKSKEDIVVFKCFDIKSLAKTELNFIISEIEYYGYLEFTYNKSTNEVYVSKLPYLIDGKVEIPIFTNDIAQIIVDRIKSYIPIENIKLTFSNPLTVFAIDNKVKEIIPAFCETKNCNIISHIVNTISLEEKRIRRHILNLKAQKDREDRAVEMAVSKKRKIYGIDPNEFENQQEFYRVMDQKICEVYSRKIEKIKRHLHLNEKKYKEMLKKGILSMHSDHMDFICNNEDFHNWCKNNGISIGKFKGVYTQNEYFGESYFYDKDVDVEQVKKEIQPVIDKYIEYRYYHDLHDPRGILALVDFIKQEIMTLPELREVGAPRINNNTLYTEVVTQLAALAGSGNPNGFSKNQFDLSNAHPIFGSHNYIYRTRSEYSKIWRSEICIQQNTFKSEIGIAIELLLQIRTLTRQLQYYRSILNEPSTALLSFKKDNDSWASIMQFPYFVRMGRDPVCGMTHELFNLLMIKPGTSIFNDANIRYFIQKGDKEVNQNCHRMIVAIPDSLEHHSLLKVIEYAHERSNDLNIICQSPDLASRVKSVLVNYELNARKNNSSYIKGRYFINIDPNYYDSFFVNTPDNKKFWHRYDYSSSYKYRRKIIYDLKTIIDMCVKENLHKNPGSRESSNDILSKMILGSYSSDDDSFDLNTFLLGKQGVDGRNLPDACDKVLAFMQLYPQKWEKELPLIDNFKWQIDNYLKCSYEEFLRKKEEMFILKECFPNSWQDVWTKLYLSTPEYNSLLDTTDVKNMIEVLAIFKSLFPDEWEDMWNKINTDQEFCDALIQVYRQDPQTAKDNIVKRKKTRNWKNEMKLWLLRVCEEDSGGFLPF